MTEFEHLLAAYRDGRVDLDALEARAEMLAGTSNGASAEALAILESARAAGLPQAAYRALRRKLMAPSEDGETVLGGAVRPGVDDSTTAMHRGLGQREGPTELNPAAGYSEEEVAKRRQLRDQPAGSASDDDVDARPDPTVTDMGLVSTGEEPTGTLWPGLYDDGRGTTQEREFQKGEVLRGRFELIAKLGEGGMGAVWKGKDLLKEEAKDRNPYVAIKLLQADFKKHPEAFIALQRETSKQQRLAHPNIATVYDFDRDERTQTVFMTMEVMEGQPLDAFIRALPADGLPVEEAMGIIEQLAAGLSYAHDNGLVHSDLKPGNCFIMSDGTVKLLDFGIARASKSKGDAEGETTLFDPAELGALTPTYATLEMFEGEAPDPRDDIFALAILAYQLFTGRHPYSRKSAPKAKELGLRPARVGKLSKRQNRGLARGLALHREERTPEVEQFLHDIRRRHSTATYAIGAALAASVLIVALAYTPILNLHEQRQHEEVIAALERPGMKNIRDALDKAARLGEQGLQKIMQDERTQRAIIAHIGQAREHRLDQWLAFVRTFPNELQRDILDDERARNSIVEDFERRIFAVFDPPRRRYDLTRAQIQVSALEELYPDSAAALKIRGELESRRGIALDKLADRFNRYLEAGLLMPEAGREYIGDVLDAVRQMDPAHHLLVDDRLRFRYGELAEAARSTGDFERAVALIDAGLDYAPGDAALKDLRYRVNTQLASMDNQRRVADVEARLAASGTGMSTFEDIEAHRDDLLVLVELAPRSPTLARARARLERALDAKLTRLIEAGHFEQAWEILLEDAALLDLGYLRGMRERLPDTASIANGQSPRQLRDDSRMAEPIERIAALLERPSEDPVWQAALEREYKTLLLLLPAGHPIVAEASARIAEHFVAAARLARQGSSLEEASSLIASGRIYAPGYDAFDVETRAQAEAQARLRATRDAERLAALVKSMKADFRSKAETNQVQEAKSVLVELRALESAREDEFVRTEAPRLLADAYARLALTRATRQDFDGAVSLASAGLAHWPKHDELLARLAEYEIALENQRFERALRDRLADPRLLDVSATATDLARLEARFPNRYADMSAELAALRRSVVLEHARSAEPLGDDAAAQLSAFDALFPSFRGKLSEDLVPILEDRVRARIPNSVEDVDALQPAIGNFASLPAEARGRLRGAVAGSVIVGARSQASRDAQAGRSMLAAALRLLPEQHALVEASRQLPLAELEHARASFASGALTRATRDLAAASDKDPLHPDVVALRSDIDNAKSRAKIEYQLYADDVAKARAHDQRELDDRYTRIAALWSDNPRFHRLAIDSPRKGECHGDLAGYGAQTGGTCYDLVAGHKGPEMVVVPAGDGVDKAYAIGKYEVSVIEFNRFCENTRRCAARSSARRRLPITQISVTDAEEYARWLSEEASRQNGHQVRYRLPTATEWEHAASAGGRQPERKFNCRVLSAGEVIAGHDLINARSGQQNGWGLANYAGNAREWVRSERGLAVRGGAYVDPLTTCGPQLGETHNGEADRLTGFRLVRELG